MSTFSDLLETLNYCDDEHVSVCWQRDGGQLEYAVMPPKAAVAAVMQTADTSNVWFSVSPTKGPIRRDGGRGGAEAVTRLAARFADLDVKPGGCPDMATARQIIDDLSALLGTRPSAIVYSGHGAQPYWPVEDGAPPDAALLRRWGRLVRLVAESRGAKVDNVFDLARILRVPGSVNNKSVPVPVTCERDTGGPVTVERVGEVLDEAGIYASDVQELSKDVVSAPEAWAFADNPCQYVKTMVAGWATDQPAARHPWLVSRAIRLAAAHRNGCLTAQGHRDAVSTLESRFRAVVTDRAIGVFEIANAQSFANDRVARMTEDQIIDELGGTKHFHTYPMNESSVTVTNHDHTDAGSGVPFGTGEQSSGGAAPNEALIVERLEKLRIDHEARRRLDDQNRAPIILPAVKSLDALLAEPDTPTRYRVDRLAPIGARVLLSAQFKAGKTTLSGNLMRSLVDEDPFLARFDIHVPARRLVLIDNELADHTLRLWLREQGITNTASVADVVSLRGKVAAFNLLDDRCRAAWAKRLRDTGCDYLMLDCLRPVLDALGLDENRDAGRFLVAFDALLDESGIGDALVVQHMGHANERARGDSRLQDWPDAIWRLVRECEEPDSARFFSAYGRDVDVPEGRLGFNPATRWITYAEGSRADAKVEAAMQPVIDILAEHARTGGEGSSGRAIEAEVALEHSQKAIRDALKLAVGRGHVAVSDGARRAKLHRIAAPCDECGLPRAAGQDSRHELCARKAAA
jgi:AAA domain